MTGMLRLTGLVLLVGSLALASAGCGRRRARAAAPPPPAPTQGGYVVAGAYQGAAVDYVSQHMQIRYQQYASDMVPTSYLQHGYLYEGQTEEFSTVFEQGYCYRVIGVAGETMVDLNLAIVDENGNPISRDTDTANFAVLGYGQDTLCPRWTGPFYVTAVAARGYGDYGVQVFRR
jgi:hypothetical protein